MTKKDRQFFWRKK